MRYLTDSDILKWGDILGIPIVPRYSNKSGRPDIAQNIGMGIVYADIIKYQFSFSVSESRIDEFNKVLKKFLSEKIGTKYIITNNSETKEYDIEISDDIFIKSEMIHEIWGRKFIRFTYDFNSHFSRVISYITYLVDAIDYIALIWGYTEDGSEINQLKYSIGDIVSTKKERSKDYMILDYVLSKVNSVKSIEFVVSEVLTDRTSSIIKYGNTFTTTESNLCFSRNYRIGDILN